MAYRPRSAAALKRLAHRPVHRVESSERRLLTHFDQLVLKLLPVLPLREEGVLDLAEPLVVARRHNPAAALATTGVGLPLLHERLLHMAHTRVHKRAQWQRSRRAHESMSDTQGHKQWGHTRLCVSRTCDASRARCTF